MARHPTYWPAASAVSVERSRATLHGGARRSALGLPIPQRRQRRQRRQKTRPLCANCRAWGARCSSSRAASSFNRALQQAPSLKGIVNFFMALYNQAFTRMTLDEWEGAVSPKVKGTWNLHNASWRRWGRR